MYSSWATSGYDYHICECVDDWFNNTGGEYYPEGVRCKPPCVYPWITDYENEVCICDESHGYYLVTDYWGVDSCPLDCPRFTGDPYKIPNEEGLNCTRCQPGMSWNTTDNLCWRDCWEEGEFTYGGLY
jgi:hypothetical protein